MNKVLFSRESDNWKTPDYVYKCFIEDGFYDPCPYCSNFDSLLMEWKDKNFVNPPYSKIKLFVEKSIMEHRKGKEVVMLLPARTDTKWFRKLVDYGCNIIFVTGRLHFNNKGSAPFPSCYVKLTGGRTFCDWRNRYDEE